MPPPRRRGANKAKANGHLRLGDLVLAKVKGFPYWPAMVRFRLSNFFFLDCLFRILSIVFKSPLFDSARMGVVSRNFSCVGFFHSW